MVSSKKPFQQSTKVRKKLWAAHVHLLKCSKFFLFFFVCVFCGGHRKQCPKETSIQFAIHSATCEEPSSGVGLLVADVPEKSGRAEQSGFPMWNANIWVFPKMGGYPKMDGL